MTIPEDITPSEVQSEIYELSTHAPKNMREFMQGLDFLFLRYAQDEWHNRKLILEYIQKKWGYSSFLQEIYGSEYDWNSDEEFNPATLRQFLEKISEIGGCLYSKLSGEDRMHFENTKWDSPVWFAGKKYFQDETIQTNDIVFLEYLLRYHLVNQWIHLTESDKKVVDENMVRRAFSESLQSFMKTILIPSVALFDITDSSELIQRILFIVSKLQELPIAMVVDFNEKLKSTSLEHHENECSIQEKLLHVNNQFRQLIIQTCGSYGTTEFTNFRVQTVLVWEKNIEDPSRCLARLIPLENFYFRKDEEIVPETPESFPTPGNPIWNRDMIVGPKGCNVFDPTGNKVFWWDMSQSDIKKIKGTYYVLTRSEWWSDAPDFLKWNIRSIGPTKDPFSPGYLTNPLTWEPVIIPNDVQWLNPEYIRMMAVAKIENWEYIKNSRKIEFKK